MKFKVGDSADLSRQVSQQDIAAFVGAVGDTNPLHSDAAACHARATRVARPSAGVPFGRAGRGAAHPARVALRTRTVQRPRTCRG